MAIAIPALVDTQLLALQATLLPKQDAATLIASSAVPPYVNGNRAADILRLLTDLVDSGTLTGVGLHAAADATNNIAAVPVATNQATLQSLLNAFRDGTGEAGGGVAAHFVIVGASEHIGADVTNVISAAAAADLATSLVLVNEVKLDLNAHMLLNAATGHYGRDLTNTIVSPDAIDLPTAIVLANEIRAKYNLHVANISAGSLKSVIDEGAFTGVDSMAGATITFAAATTTVALRGVTAVVLSNTVNDLLLANGQELPAVPVIGDTFTLAYSTVDADLDHMAGNKGAAASASNPYGPGPSFVNAVVTVVQGLGGTLPAYLNTQAKVTAAAESFGVGSPHAGAGSQGHGGAALISDMLTQVRTAVAAYTVPT